VSEADRGSVTHWLGPLKAGDEEAARRLWTRYFAGLVRLAHARLRDTPRGAADEEDVALSAFHSLCNGAAAGRFPQLEGRDDLWRLLATITARKAVDQIRRARRQKRGGGRVRGDADRPGDQVEALAQVAGDEPTPEFAALMAEEYLHLLGRLPDETLRRVAAWKLEGYTNDEIADRLGCGLRTVERKLAVIRASWLAAEPD
jgi:DNA-directed RNA polymerase specialized sigma24 family protein